ncbi:MAG: tetratricopeptide repeat protein [Sandaracinaceae bacterium]
MNRGVSVPVAWWFGRMLAFCLAFLAVAPHASAQSMDDALGHFERGEVEEARAAFESILDAGNAVPATVARVHRHLGILYFAEGRDEEALRAFERSLAIEPEQPVPTEVSPDQQTVFRTVQRAREDQPMSFAVRETPDAIVAQLVQAPPGFVTEVVAESGDQRWEGDPEQVRIVLDGAASLDDRIPVTLLARDTHGNVVLRVRRSFDRNAPGEPPNVGAGEDFTWVVGLVLGLVVAGAAAVTIGVLATQQDGYMTPVIEWPM